jgi:hypothetical protein
MVITLKSRSWEVELNANWEALKTILSDPKKTLPFFPYFKEFRGNRVRFEVPRFVFNFGYEFDLDIGFGERAVIYTFTGERGILTVIFRFEGNRLKVTASWSGFAERIMGKPLGIFAKGIAEAVKEFCSSATCPVIRLEGEGEVAMITPESAPAFLKRVVIEHGLNVLVEGRAEVGTYLAAKIVGGKLTELRVKQGINESIVETDVSVLELDESLFYDLPLNMKFRVKVRKFTP